MTWSCIHETGHALYEQGLPEEHYGLPAGEACSYSMHESQSRLWENNVGRSFGFWQHYFPELLKYFPEQFKSITTEQFYNSINKVQPSLIRTEADELTYHFHVYIRYELEKRLMEGLLQPKDIPAFWKEQYKTLLDINVPDDKQGALQDVHWSHGSFGYFPTYTLGSLYAVQFFDTFRKTRPEWDSDIISGNLSPLKQWLSTNIYPFGRYYNSLELCNICTGEPLNTSHFAEYIHHKFISNSVVNHE